MRNLVDRRKRGDLIQYFKINNGFDKVIRPNPPITIENSITRGHNQKMIRIKLHIGTSYSRTVNQFKNRLDIYAIKDQNKFY